MKYYFFIDTDEESPTYNEPLSVYRWAGFSFICGIMTAKYLPGRFKNRQAGKRKGRAGA